LTAWLVAQTNAHIGGNQVLGFSSSAIADKVGRDMESTV